MIAIVIIFAMLIAAKIKFSFLNAKKHKPKKKRTKKFSIIQPPPKIQKTQKYVSISGKKKRIPFDGFKAPRSLTEIQ